MTTASPSIAARLLTTGDVHVTSKSNACVVNTGIELHARLDSATHHAVAGNLEFEDLVTFLRLFSVEFEELLTEADDLATEAMEKADKYDEHENAIDQWQRVYDETSATDADDVIEAFEKADKLDYLVGEIREYA